MEAGTATWLAEQDHHGQNIGTTDAHVLFVEFKEAAPGGTSQGASQPGPSANP